MTLAVVHFSGGSDSTLVASQMAEKHDLVYLLTYDRVSFIGVQDYTLDHFNRLCRVYGKEKFRRVVLPLDRWHRQVCYDRYFYFAKKYRLAVSSLVFSKLAMHWRSAIFALQNGVTTVADGAVPYMELYPDQNQEISLKALGEFYSCFGIRYENPVFGIAHEVEQRLYDKGITDQPEVRGTTRDRQVFYAEQVLLALFLKYYLTRHGKGAYVRVLSELFQEKIQFMKETVEDWKRSPNGSLVSKLGAR